MLSSQIMTLHLSNPLKLLQSLVNRQCFRCEKVVHIDRYVHEKSEVKE